MALMLTLVVLVLGCGGAGGSAPDGIADEGTDIGPTPDSGYPLVASTLTDPGLFVFEPFNYLDTPYPQGLHGQEGGFGFSGAWNDMDGDVTDRVIGNDTLAVASDMSPLGTGGRSIHFNTTGSAIFRDLDRTYGADGTDVWVSYVWITTDTTAVEGLQLVDFNTGAGGFGLGVGQGRGLAGDNASDGMFDLEHHPGGISADIATRDNATHFILMRFSFGTANSDTVSLWWDPQLTTFDEAVPTATLSGIDATFSRITLRSAAADSFDELRIGTTRDSVTSASSRFTTYHVGNSLTWDSMPDGIEALAGQRGILQDTGYHIRCGQTLQGIWSQPTDTCIAPVPDYGHFRDALGGHRWTAITLQPFRGATSTLRTDETVILDMIELARGNPANAETRFYVYATWPERTNFAARWTAPVSDEDDTPTVQAREYYAHLMARLRDRTSAPVYLIPAGEVLFVVDQKLRAGLAPGYGSVADLYRDEVHLGLDIGRFVAGLTKFATMHAQPPHGIIKPAAYYGASSAVFSADVYSVVYDAVWEVVSADIHTGLRNP